MELGKDTLRTAVHAALRKAERETTDRGHFLKREVLTGERAADPSIPTAQQLKVPATAQAMLAARIDRMEPENKRLLQAASVIGTAVPYELLKAVAEEPPQAFGRTPGSRIPLRKSAIPHTRVLFPARPHP